MMSISSLILFVFTAFIPFNANSQLDFLHNNLASSVEWQDDRSSTTLTKSVAKQKLKSFLASGEKVHVTRSHPVKLSNDKTYGIFQLEKGGSDYRLFFYCQKLDGSNSHKIVKIRLTKS